MEERKETGMIAACPRCGARYRFERGRLRPEGARLRCARCEAVFQVRPPAAAPAREPMAAAGEGRDRERLVLVADPRVESGKATGGALARWGLQTILVHDGVEAILTIQRTLPSVVVLDAALPKMFGFQICELMKRNESLRDIKVVLVGAIHERERYRRPPSELYGADAYVERPQLPEALRTILRGFGLTLRADTGTEVREEPGARTQEPMLRRVEEPVAPRPPVPQPIAPEPVAPERPEPRPAEPPAPLVEAEDLQEEIVKAERLARIIVSDIALYNEEKLAAAIRAGDVVRGMEDELAEGRALFAQRIDSRVRERRDFLGDELRRVAEQRSAR